MAAGNSYCLGINSNVFFLKDNKKAFILWLNAPKVTAYKYDSFVDCGMLFSIPLKKLMEGEYFGTLTSQDLQGIFEVLKTTETLTNKEKKRFGII